jgi:hypothetical protein
MLMYELLNSFKPEQFLLSPFNLHSTYEQFSAVLLDIHEYILCIYNKDHIVVQQELCWKAECVLLVKCS